MGEQAPRRHDEDTQAILNRRRFLIESTLVGAGLSALAAGCGKEEPKVCLSEAIVPPAKPKTGTEPQPCLSPRPDTATPPQPCLSPPVEPQPCLKPVPPEPRPCLELPPPPEPKVCLTVPPPPKTGAKAKFEVPEPCLSVRTFDDK